MVLSLFLSLLSTLSYGFDALPKKAPLAAGEKMTPAQIELGKMLYFDKRLSKNNTVSCQTCHDVNKGGVDGLPVSKGIHGQLGPRNAPTVYNAAFLTTQFWDGRENTLEDQAKGPLINPKEMGMKDHDEVVAKIKSIPGYLPYFEKAFGKENPITIEHVAKAIAHYERTLITPNSPFDRYQRGDKKAMSKRAIRGMKTFEQVGCTSCHSGVNFSGPPLPVGTGFFMRFPTFDNPYVEKYGFKKDLGRFEATKNPVDKHMWRVPTLRNIALTAPYFHNGAVKSLDEAVRVMAKSQLNVDLKKKQVKDIVAFLKSLSGKTKKVKEPKIP
ncbi:MAG: cytochrome-c peroxidase [Bdellovibrionaceae bacterium]|nr:cytochrome-c peroxidase [Pseudobdellovibrionaceae bacterium]|tara:strand:- start:4092 stop:5072 length:981 start_codon:yes stop_codon:yes gene_type:complete